MPKKIGTNSKATAGRERKAEQAAVKSAAEQAKQAAIEDAEWQKGSNQKKAQRDQDAARKADEAAEKRREKQALLEAEEAALGPGGTAKKAPGGAKKKKPKNDLSMLEDALQSAADKKVKKKRAEERERERLQQQKQQEQKEEKPVDPLLANTDQMIGLEDMDEVGRKANQARMEAEGVSGINAALESLNVKVSAGGATASNPKALYLEFEEKMMPMMKEDFPGLRLSQYKERIFNLWKKSPDNPANQIAK